MCTCVLLNYGIVVDRQFERVPRYEGLSEYADKSQLMPDLGGYLEYEHQDWVKFRMVSSPCVCMYVYNE